MTRISNKDTFIDLTPPPAACPYGVKQLLEVCTGRNLLPPEPPPFPERHDFFKSGVPTYYNEGEHCYLWASPDANSVLLNKTTIRSCHALDSGYHFRVGNFNYAYNPYKVSLFAGYYAPDQNSLLEIVKKYRREIIVKMLRHHTVANLVLCRDRITQSPYLFLSRIYTLLGQDYMFDFFVRYLRKVTKETGIGLCLPWGLARAYNIQRRELKSIELLTPEFTLPFQTPRAKYPGVLAYSGDYQTKYQGVEGKDTYVFSVNAEEFIPPHSKMEDAFPQTTTEKIIAPRIIYP